jgi:hypothetical protein
LSTNYDYENIQETQVSDFELGFVLGIMIQQIWLLRCQAYEHRNKYIYRVLLIKQKVLFVMNLQCVLKFIEPHLRNKYDIEIKSLKLLVLVLGYAKLKGWYCTIPNIFTTTHIKELLDTNLES